MQKGLQHPPEAALDQEFCEQCGKGFCHLGFFRRHQGAHRPVRRRVEAPVGGSAFPVLGHREDYSRCSQAQAKYLVPEPAIISLCKSLRRFCQATDTGKELEAVLRQPIWLIAIRLKSSARVVCGLQR